MSAIKKAASLIVCAIAEKPLPEIQVLMLQRSNYGHYGGLTVFPGGKLEQVDSLSDWKQILGSDSLNEITVNKLAALRETFEESGLLLLQSGTLNEKERMEWRTKVVQNSTSFLDLMKSKKLKPLVDDLVHFSNWISPKTFDKTNRFDTQFFLSLIDEKQKDDVQVDGKEAINFIWKSPKEYLAAFKRNEIELLPPQYCTLFELLNVKPESFQDYIKNKRAINPTTYLPEVIGKTSDGNGAVMALPGDGKHSTTLGSPERHYFEIVRANGKVRSIELFSNKFIPKL